MARQDQTFVSGIARPAMIRLRSDLHVEQQRYHGKSFWVIKDPVRLKYFRFDEEEYAILQMLDGQNSLAEIKERFERDFAPQRISYQQLQHLISMLHRGGLVQATTAGQGEKLLQRRRENDRKKWTSAWANVLYLRCRGIDPTFLLKPLDGLSRMLFSRIGGAVVGGACLAAVLLLVTHLDQFLTRLPQFQQFFAMENWLWLAVTLMLTKVLHEFGHGMACRRFGGECHEMGVMFLVFTPCLYCNVTDSWMVTNKWHRATIGAAGMYFEAALAAVATFLWWFSEPGWLHYTCLNIMFVCSVSTFLFNANPLMKFDGYYILSDLVEIPNLRQKASMILQRQLQAWFLGTRLEEDPFLPRRFRFLFGMYSIAAFGYRWLVTISILWMLNQIFAPYGLRVLGQLLMLVSLYGLAIHPIVKLLRFLSFPGRWSKVKYFRVAFVGSLLLGLGLFALTVPIPHSVQCNVRLKPRQPANVYVHAGGALREVMVQPGERVVVGQPLAVLDSPEHELRIAAIIGKIKLLEQSHEDLRRQALQGDNRRLAELAELKQSLIGLRDQLSKAEEKKEKLVLRATRDGVVAPVDPTFVEHDGSELTEWTGRPLDAKNLGAYLQAGTLACKIVTPQDYVAELSIAAETVEAVSVGQDVQLVFQSARTQRFNGVLEHLSQEDDLDDDESGKIRDVAKRVQIGARSRRQVNYLGSVPLSVDDSRVILGVTGEARIITGRRTLAARLWRYVCHTFRLQA